MSYELVLKGRNVLVDGQFKPLEVGVSGGVIREITRFGVGLSGKKVIHLPDQQVLIPGLVDTHVHVNEPGRTEWEGYRTASRAAALGGITTIIDMPLNSIPATTSTSALEVKRELARSQIFVDVGFWGGAVPDNLHELRELYDAGVYGFKLFMPETGIDDFLSVPRELRPSFVREVAEIGATILVHAEDQAELEKFEPKNGDPRSYRRFLSSRPESVELKAIEEIIDLARQTGGHVHIVHVSAASAIPLIREAKQEGVMVTAETCPHYLFFEAESIEDGETLLKCTPPIRSSRNRDQLWEGILDGTLDFIVSDHSPSPPELKAMDTGSFELAWGGISSLQVSLQAVWSEAHRRSIPLERVIEKMSSATADFCGLSRKGRIAVGNDADLVVFDPTQSVRVYGDHLEHRHKITAYEGQELLGQVEDVYLAGESIRGLTVPSGRLIQRERS